MVHNTILALPWMHLLLLWPKITNDLKGVFVNAIEKGGPADKAGIRGANLDQYYKRHSGDMIVAIDGHSVTKAEYFMSYMHEHKTPDDSVNLKPARWWLSYCGKE